MNTEPNHTITGWAARGRLNRAIGWSMVLAGLAAIVVFDPWYFQVADAELPVDGWRQMARQAVGVMLAMALLQLAVGRVLGIFAYPQHAQRTAAWLTSAGAILYAVGYAAWLAWPQAAWLVLAGSLLNVTGFAVLGKAGPSGRYASPLRIVLPVVCFGMLLDFATGLFLVGQDWQFVESLGPPDGVRLRMLRLARVAAIALSVLVLLYEGLMASVARPSRWTRWSEAALVAGAVGMPSVLAAACFLSLHLKYLLPLPATAVVTGVVIGLCYAWHKAQPLELWGWSLIAISVSTGMLMGLYAFAGPLPTPSFLGDYLTLSHQRSILAHSYAILLGLVSIFLTREMESASATGMTARVGTGLLMAGSSLTIGVLAIGIGLPLPAWTTALGPTVVVLGTVVCLRATRRFVAGILK